MKIEYLKLLLIQSTMPFMAILSYLVPKKKGLYVFGSTKQERYQGNPRAIFEYCAKERSEIIPVFLTKNTDIYNTVKAKGLPIEISFFKKMWILLRGEYFFIETTPMDISPYYILFGRFKIINMWHSTPLKKIEADSKNLDKLYAFVTSFNNKRCYDITATDEISASRMASAFQNKNVSITGYPRNDILFKKQRGDLEELNYLTKYDKVITYAPTFRDNTNLTPFTEKGLVAIDEYCRKNNYVFLIKEHPNKQQIIINDKTNIKQVSKEVKDIQELMLYTDIMISDYSGLIFDYALLDLPIVFYSFDIQSYIDNDRELYFEYENTFPGPFPKNDKDLLETITTLDTWFNDTEYQKRFQDFRKVFNFYQDGDSSKRIIDMLK